MKKTKPAAKPLELSMQIVRTLCERDLVIVDGARASIGVGTASCSGCRYC
ncbi:MAG TPA: hypothetical protein VL463_11935 [Kofleriaceae bacterium]|nr:hypothetical protein [Kofleriaceae bacterium]